jgi:hypothetical protein
MVRWRRAVAVLGDRLAVVRRVVLRRFAGLRLVVVLVVVVSAIAGISPLG